MGAVEAEGAGLDFGQAGAALGAGKLLGEDQFLAVLHVHLQDALALLEGGFHRLGHAGDLGIRADDKTVHDEFDVVPLLLVQGQAAEFLQQVDLSVDAYADESRPAGGLENVFVLALLAPDLGRQEHDAAALRQGEDGVDDLLHRLAFHGAAALGAVGAAYPGEEQP